LIPIKVSGRRASPAATSPVVQDALRGIRRTVGTTPRRKSAATADRIRLMLDACPDTMIGIRDRALLALGFAGAFRRSELVALKVADLEEVADGYRVTIRRSKTDQTGEGAEIVIPRGLKIRPVAAVQALLRAAEIENGYLFPQGSSRRPCAAQGNRRPGRGRDRQAVRPGDRTRPSRVQRPQPARRVLYERGREWCLDPEGPGDVASQEHGRPGRLRPPGRHVQGPRGRGFPVTDDVGLLYVLANRDSSLAKIGMTRNGTPDARASDYERAHGITWSVFWQARTEKIAQAEASAHRELRDYRFVNAVGAKEVFHVTLRPPSLWRSAISCRLTASPQHRQPARACSPASSA
jgi:hypothetical protein